MKAPGVASASATGVVRVKPSPAFPVYRLALVLLLVVPVVLAWRSFSATRERWMERRAIREQRFRTLENAVAAHQKRHPEDPEGTARWVSRPQGTTTR